MTGGIVAILGATGVNFGEDHPRLRLRTR
ncbi:hypothetical protein ACP76Z_02565 [Vibrio cholerae]